MHVISFNLAINIVKVPDVFQKNARFCERYKKEKNKHLSFYLLSKSFNASMKHVSIQKEISPGCSLEGLTLATSCERVDSLEKTLML